MTWKLIAPLDLQAFLNAAAFTREIWGLLGEDWSFDSQSSLRSFFTRCQILEELAHGAVTGSTGKFSEDGVIPNGRFWGFESDRGLMGWAAGSGVSNFKVPFLQLIRGLF